MVIGASTISTVRTCAALGTPFGLEITQHGQFVPRRSASSDSQALGLTSQ